MHFCRRANIVTRSENTGLVLRLSDDNRVPAKLAGPLFELVDVFRNAGFALEFNPVTGKIAGLWARLYGAQASMLMGNDTAALAAVHMLTPMLSADEPPRLRLASLSLQALLAERMDALERADEHRLAAHKLRDSLLRQRFKLRPTLRRNAEDVMQHLATNDRDWQERSMPARTMVEPATPPKDASAG